MSNGTSSIMFSSSSSSSSSSSATKIGNLIEKMGQTPIHSCIIGISQLKFHSLSNNISHAALLLTTEKRSSIIRENCESTEGILIEYGNYPPDKSEDKEKEEQNIKNNLVIYRYTNKGGLRYYTNTIKFFKDNFCDVGSVTVNICKDNQKTFENLLDILAPLSENKWIKENYNPIDYGFKKSHNCQDFVCHVIDILKPSYDMAYITKGNKSSAIEEQNKENILPSPILNTLKNYVNYD